MATAQTVIQDALCDLGVIRPGETPTATVLADCLSRLNQRMAAHSIEKLLAQTQAFVTLTLSVGQTRYTVGSGGSFNTGSRAESIISWKATNGVYTAGGPPLTMDLFDAEAKAMNIQFTAANAQVSTLMAPYFITPAVALSNSLVPQILGADSSSPLLNVAIWPPPGSSPASMELCYWTALPQFATLSDTVTLPDGWLDFLHFDLAMALLPRYGRQNFDGAALASNSATSKAKIQALNAPTPPTAQGAQ